MGRIKKNKGQGIVVIAAHAAKLFISHGYSNTSMEDIANSVQIKKSSIYHHFPSRKVLTRTVAQRAISLFLMQFDTLSKSEYPQFLVESLKMIFELGREHYFLLIHLAIECRYRGYHEITRLIEDFFNTTQMEIIKTFDINHQEGTIFMGLLHNSIYLWLVFADRSSFNRAFDYLRGIHHVQLVQAAVLQA